MATIQVATKIARERLHPLRRYSNENQSSVCESSKIGGDNATVGYVRVDSAATEDNFMFAGSDGVTESTSEAPSTEDSNGGCAHEFSSMAAISCVASAFSSPLASRAKGTIRFW